jgi:hypothetical protein
MQNLHEFKQGIKNPSLKNYRQTLTSGLDLLREYTSDYGYPILQGIFNNHKDFNDLISKIEIYFATNGAFNFYRYSKYDKEYIESFNLDFSKHDIRSLLILIRCYNISQGDISKASNELIQAYEYVDANKKNKSLETLKNELPDISEKYIENRFEDRTYNVSKGGELAKMINANLYLLSYNHKAFTQSEKHGRIHNVFTNLNRVYRTNELAFQLHEIDISSANPQIIDQAFGFDRWENVYSNLMKSYNITRNEAKLKYNATLNREYLTIHQAKTIYLKCGYSEAEAHKIASLTAQSKKGDVYRFMANHEGEIMDNLVGNNFKNIPCIRLYDAVYYEPEFYKLDDIDYGGVSFGHDNLPKAELNLNLKMNTYKTVLTTPQKTKYIVKKYFNRHDAKKIYFGKNFTFYDRKFKMVSGTFNINKPIISKDGVYSTPSENDFLNRLKRLHTILYYLNGSHDSFYECVENIHQQDGLDFNKAYIYQYFKNHKHQDIKKYIINREWVYNGGVVIENHKRFNLLFHNDRRNMVNAKDRPKLIEDIKELKASLEDNQLHHIDKKAYYYANRYESGEIIDAIHELIGCKRKKTVENINNYLGGVKLLDTLYSHNNIGCSFTLPPSIKSISKTVNNNKTLAKTIYNIMLNREDIIIKLDYAIQNIKQGNTESIFDIPTQTEIQGVKTIAPKEAFNYPIDYSNGYYDTPREVAINMSLDYFKGWAKHQTIKNLFQGAKGGITQNLDNHVWKKEVLAVQMYKHHHPEPINQAI